MDTTRVAIASVLHTDHMDDNLLRVAPEGAEGLDGAGPEDVLVVEGRDRRADHGADPEDPLIIPGLVLVVDDGGPEAPGRVDAGAGDGDGGQVDHEHGEANREGRQHLEKDTSKANIIA